MMATMIVHLVLLEGIFQGFHSRSQLTISLLQDTEPKYQAKCFKMITHDFFLIVDISIDFLLDIS